MSPPSHWKDTISRLIVSIGIVLVLICHDRVSPRAQGSGGAGERSAPTSAANGPLPHDASDRRRRKTGFVVSKAAASWVSSGTHTGVNSLAGSNCASDIASRRFVFTRSPSRLGIWARLRSRNKAAAEAVHQLRCFSRVVDLAQVLHLAVARAAFRDRDGVGALAVSTPTKASHFLIGSPPIRICGASHPDAADLGSYARTISPPDAPRHDPRPGPPEWCGNLHSGGGPKPNGFGNSPDL